MIRFLFALFTLAAAPLSAQPVERPVTILISIDGFRADYLDRTVAPRLKALADAGARAAMHPSFPSVTFPNHWTLVTGLRPDRNGIVANVMEDTARPGVVFTMANNDPFWWLQAEPLWITAEKAGVRTATMFWPGSNVDFGGVRPRDWWLYAKENSEAQRVDAVIDWLRRPAAARPAFVTLYFDTVDTAGHKFGPDAEKTNDAIRAVDTQIGRLVDGVAALGLRANYVIVADHGMAATSPERVVKLWEVAKAKDFRAVTGGVVAGIEPAKGREARLAKALLKPHPHMQCARKGDLPTALHYGQNPRVPAFICIAEIGWYVLTAPMSSDKPFEGGGAHGYDPANREMDALFVVNGPAFRAGTALPAFDNVDIYPLVAGLIGVAPRPSDGNATVFAPALTNPR
jgi:predicted AlkP superfamily pyrophosphatase or phosphodiesterase